MAYSSKDSVFKKIDARLLLQLLNDENAPEDEVDWTDEDDVRVIRFEQAASEAQEEIDPYLRGKYTLPLASVPNRIISLSDDITIYNIYKRRNRENMPDSILSIYKDCVKSLEKIQLGKLDLDCEKVTAEQGTTGEFTTNKNASDRVFNNSLWNKF